MLTGEQSMRVRASLVRATVLVALAGVCVVSQALAQDGTLKVHAVSAFQYDGYWVTFLDPWPETWDPTWYETDDVYLDYTGDGYYLFDRMHPGIGIAVTVAF
jgi:hypothetical protein